MKRTCPHCGAPLAEEASFCPVCAASLIEKQEPSPPRPITRRVLRIALAAVLIAAAALAVWLWQRPHTYGGDTASVTYTDEDGSYLLMLADGADLAGTYEPLAEKTFNTNRETDYRWPSRLFVFQRDDGTNVGEYFMTKVQSAAVEIIQPEDAEVPFQCSEPAPHEAAPDAAMVSLLDFTAFSPSPVQIVWTLHMLNGDTIVLTTRAVINIVETYDIYPEDEAMETPEALQAVIDRMAETVEPKDTVNLHLPPVTYDSGIVLHDRNINLYGAEEGGRTVFTAGLRMEDDEVNALDYFSNIDFLGDGSGVALSTAGRTWVMNCTFRGWKTAVLVYGSSWCNLTDSVLEDNTVGLHFNAQDQPPSDSSFTGNTFLSNGTAVLLERVPSDFTMNFAESRFAGNGTDIDNRCDQPLDISKAIFQ